MAGGTLGTVIARASRGDGALVLLGPAKDVSGRAGRRGPASEVSWQRGRLQIGGNPGFCTGGVSPKNSLNAAV